MTVQQWLTGSKYDREGAMILNDGEYIADIRGLGSLSKKLGSEQSAYDFMDQVGEFIEKAIAEKLEREKQIEKFQANYQLVGELKMHAIPVDKFPEPDIKHTVQNIPPIELKPLKNPE